MLTGSITKEDLDTYFAALRLSESQVDGQNSFNERTGAAGRWQFIPGTVAGLGFGTSGYDASKEGESYKFKWDKFTFTDEVIEKYNLDKSFSAKEQFLSSSALQNDVMIANLESNRDWLKEKRPQLYDDIVKGDADVNIAGKEHTLTMSMFLYGAHLGGVKNVTKFIEESIDIDDGASPGTGTHISRYMAIAHDAEVAAGLLQEKAILSEGDDFYAQSRSGGALLAAGGVSQQGYSSGGSRARNASGEEATEHDIAGGLGDLFSGMVAALESFFTSERTDGGLPDLESLAARQKNDDGNTLPSLASLVPNDETGEAADVPSIEELARNHQPDKGGRSV